MNEYTARRCCTIVRIMRAIVQRTTANVDILALEELPTPRPRPREVLVRIAACGGRSSKLIASLRIGDWISRAPVLIVIAYAAHAASAVNHDKAIMYDFRVLDVARSPEELRTILRIDSWFRIFLICAAIAVMAVVVLAGGNAYPAATLLVAVAASLATILAWRRFTQLLPA